MTYDESAYDVAMVPRICNDRRSLRRLLGVIWPQRTVIYSILSSAYVWVMVGIMLKRYSVGKKTEN